jgi:acyl-coenzyme A thioesterase PaaI-like protein
MKIRSLEAGKCQATMKQRRSIENPFKSVHAAALINFGEAVGGMAVLTALEKTKVPTKGIVVSLSADYFKKARGVLSAECVLDTKEEGGKIVSLGKLSADDTLSVVATIKDRTGEDVALVTAIWKITEGSKKAV